MQKPSLIALAMPALLAVAALTLSGCGDTSSESEPQVTTIGPVVTEETPAAAPEDGAAPEAAPALQLVADYEGTKPYPLNVCIVSGEELGSMGNPVVMAYGDQQVKFCCASCKTDFVADPQKFLDAMAAKAAAATNQPAAEPATEPAAEPAAGASLPADVRPYPLTVCLVSGHALGDNPVSMIYGKQEVKFCCEDCKPDFVEDPASYLAKLASNNVDANSDSGKAINTGLNLLQNE